MDEDTPAEITYFTPKTTGPSINPGDCDDKNAPRASDATLRRSIENALKDGVPSPSMMGFPISNNVDSRNNTKNPYSSDIFLERVSAESPSLLGASLPDGLPQSGLSLFASLQDVLVGAMLPHANEINSESYFAAREQKKVALAMTPESVWELIPSLVVTASPEDLSIEADLKQRAMKVYEKHCGRRVYDPQGMKFKADKLWECGSYGDAEELDRLTIEVAHTKLGAEHLYTLKLMGNLAAAIWGQGRLEEAEKIESEVVEKMKRILGEYDEDTLQYLGNLSCTYRTQGK